MKFFLIAAILGGCGYMMANYSWSGWAMLGAVVFSYEVLIHG